MSATRTSLSTMSPSVFAFVMATGAISIAAELASWHALSVVLWIVAGLAWCVLAVLLVLRLVAYRREVAGDIGDPTRAFGFFTLVAGTAVLGIRFSIAGLAPLAAALGVLALVLWILLGYGVPWTVVVRDHGLDGAPGTTDPARTVSDPADLVRSVDGVWFVWVVASQAVAILAVMLQPVAPTSPVPGLVALICWATGVGLYFVVGGAFALRILRYGITADDLTPASWVVMGALAISSLAAAHLSTGDGAVLEAVQPFARGAALTLWGCASALIPALLALGFWRHVVRRVSTRYVVAMWAMVFPMGVYSAVSATLGAGLAEPALGAIGTVGVCVALASWLVVCADFAVTRILARTRPRHAD